MTILDAITAHLGNLKRAGKAPNTISNYRADLMKAARVLGSNGVTEASGITVALVAEVVASWSALSSAARQRHAVSFRGFLAFLWKKGLVTEEAYQAVPLVPVTRLRETVPSQVVVRRVVESAALGSRARALLEVLALGIYPQEAADALFSDFDADNGALTVGTGKTRRTVSMPAASWAGLKTYIETERQQMVMPGSAHLFLGYRGKGLSRQEVWRAVRTASKQTGIQANTHIFRAARVAAMLAAQVPPAQVAKEMGHGCTQALGRYKNAVIVEAA